MTSVAVRIVVGLVFVAAGVGAWFVLQSIADDPKIIEAPRLPLFLVLHMISFAAWIALLWLGVPNPHAKSSRTRLNTFFRVIAVPSLFLGGVVYSRFWQAIF